MPLQEAERVQLLSPRRSSRSLHKPVKDLPLEGPANQTDYDSDDEGEAGGTEEAEELEDAPEPLPPPQVRPWVLFRTLEVS